MMEDVPVKSNLGLLIAKAAFTKIGALFTSTVHLKLRKKLV